MDLYKTVCEYAGQHVTDKALYAILNNPDLKITQKALYNTEVLDLEIFSLWLESNGLNLFNIKGKCRERRIIRYRHTLLYFYITAYNRDRIKGDRNYVTLHNICAMFGHRDHSTILKAYNTYEKKLKKNRMLQMVYRSFLDYLKINLITIDNFNKKRIQLNSI